MNKSLKVRLKFIDAMFHQHGRLSFFQIKDTFGVTEVTVARDFKKYRMLQPHVFHDPVAKSYIVDGNFERIKSLWGSEDPGAYLLAFNDLYGSVRLKFIDAMLKVYGRIGRDFPSMVFSTSDLTSIRDFKEYALLQEIRYDRSTRNYYPKTASLVASLWEEENPEEFLESIKMVYGVFIGDVQVTLFTVKDVI